MNYPMKTEALLNIRLSCHKMNVRLLSLQALAALHYLMIHIVIALDEYCEVHRMNPSLPVVLEVGHSPVPGHSHVPNPDDTLRILSTSREL